MNYSGFQWDASNWSKCGQHGVSRGEIESLFSQRLLIVEDVANSGTEQRFRAIGVASSKRYVFIVFTLRDGPIRPLSPRYLHAKEVRRYEKDNS